MKIKFYSRRFPYFKPTAHKRTVSQTCRKKIDHLIDLPLPILNPAYIANDHQFDKPVGATTYGSKADHLQMRAMRTNGLMKRLL